LSGGETAGGWSDAPDIAGWGYSLANLGELLFGCLDAVEARSVLEIGAFKGELTSELLDWAGRSGASITALDPEPPEELLELGKQRPELDLLLRTSHDALREIDFPDAIVVDGDHNYYTLSEELRIVSERTSGPDMPLMLFHDVSWPHARRDSYYVPERIPEEHRQPIARDICLVPWDPGVVDRGMPFPCAAEHEGGPRNGTLTALEDFVSAHEEMRLVTVPAFFGLGVIWHSGAPWAERVAAVVGPWDRHPILQRLEENRVAHLCLRHHLASDLNQSQRISAEKSDLIRERDARLHEQSKRLNQQETVLRSLLSSRAFALAERLSRIRQRGTPAVSRDRIRDLLAGSEFSGARAGPRAPGS
jgi:hypothetical protein